MKASALPALIFLIGIPACSVANFNVGAATHPIHQESLTAKLNAWNECLQYIDSHSISASPVAVARLWSDVNSGAVTWTINPAIELGNYLVVLSGGNVGWPDGEVIEFANQEDLETAVNLILNATYMSR